MIFVFFVEVSTSEKAYKSLLRLSLENVYSAWKPYYKAEMVHYRAAGIILYISRDGMVF